MEKRLLFSVFMEEKVLLRAPGSVTANQIAVGIELLCSFPASGAALPEQKISFNFFSEAGFPL